tara:strand:+ start:295 stop:564 length:270 start_codon:yes stop_codon:yes gene_type:complete
MNLEIKANILIELKRKTWYYETSDIEKRRKDGYPAGGFLSKGEKLLICEVKKNQDALKIKALHYKKNNVYMIFNKEDTSYFFEAINTCN